MSGKCLVKVVSVFLGLGGGEREEGNLIYYKIIILKQGKTADLFCIF